jgi:anionic cell wall polymer biosynthesis LytR-Cps2A-Psr (LCP) family protein
MVDVEVNYASSNELYKTERMQICLAYDFGTDDFSSSQLVARAASRVLYNVPIEYYFTLNMDGVYALADVVGGVLVDPLETIPGTDIVAGQQIVLNGVNAAKYVQWRDTTQLHTALGRQARQMQFVKALAAKTLNTAKGNPTALVDIYNTMTGYATTNLEASEVSYLATVMANGSAEFDTVSLQGESVFNDESPWEQYILDKASVYQTVLDVYYEQVD